MVPALDKGDLVSVNRVPADQLKVGDIITFINPENQKSTVTHRIVELPSSENKGLYITKGDANPIADEPIQARSILGKQSFSVPYIGYATDFIRQPLGLALIIYLPALMIVIAELKRLALYFKSQEKYTVSWRRKAHSTIPTAKLLPLLLLLPMFIMIPAARAVFGTSATLTDNVISMRRPPQPTACTTGGNNTSVNVTGSANINISNSNNQTAQTGNATSTSGNATSGNATNCNSTNINVTVNN